MSGCDKCALKVAPHNCHLCDAQHCSSCSIEHQKWHGSLATFEADQERGLAHDTNTIDIFRILCEGAKHGTEAQAMWKEAKKFAKDLNSSK